MNVPNIWEWVDDFDGQKTKGMFIFEFQIAFYPKKKMFETQNQRILSILFVMCFSINHNVLPFTHH
jgi:hypothetical protein